MSEDIVRERGVRTHPAAKLGAFTENGSRRSGRVKKRGMEDIRLESAHYNGGGGGCLKIKWSGARANGVDDDVWIEGQAL
jgi:hypothetical protein